jgi:hypothetical protein
MNIYNYFQAHSDPEVWQQLVLNIDRHQDLLAQLGNLALNSCNVAAKVFNQIPPFIGDGAQTALASSGLFFLDYFIMQIDKGWCDFQRAIQVNDPIGMALTALKVIIAAADLLLTVAAFAAACSALLGASPTALMLYGVMRPVALGSVATGIGLILADYWSNESILTQMEELSRSDKEVQQLFNCFVEMLVAKEGQSISADSDQQRFAARVIRQLDPAILNKSVELLRDVADVEREKSYRIIFNDYKKDIEVRHLHTKSHMELTVFYYGCLALSKIYRGTLLDASIQLTCSLLYTGELAFTKYDLEEKGRRNEETRKEISNY